MISFNHPHRPPCARIAPIPTAPSTNNIRAMIAFRELALYLAANADHQLDRIRTHPNIFRAAFLDDDSDYIPAAIDMMNALTSALTADDSELECDILLSRIATDRPFSITPNSLAAYPRATDAMIRIDDLPLDAPSSLPIPAYDD